MSEGNPGALTAMMHMLQADPMSVMNIIMFDSMGIYGSKIYKLWNDCCDRNTDRLKDTLAAFREGKFTQEEIHTNLDQSHAKPFIYYKSEE